MIRSISDTEEKEREASRVSLAASLASERRARNRSTFLVPCLIFYLFFSILVGSIPPSLNLLFVHYSTIREKLLAMKRYSGFLKRPEILETVYRSI